MSALRTSVATSEVRVYSLKETTAKIFPRSLPGRPTHHTLGLVPTLRVGKQVWTLRVPSLYRKGRTPSLVVADRANARLQYFTFDGRHICFVKDLLLPAHFDIRDDVLLVPDLHARVSLFDKDNKPIVHLGDDAEWRKMVLDGFKVRRQPAEWLAGKFVHPYDACFDRDGNIFVVEWVERGRVTLLRRVA